MSTILLANLQDTEALGRRLGTEARPGGIITLGGDLGAGKTTLTRFIAQGLGVKDNYITSPTFSIIHEYKGRLPLYHMDLYRLQELSMDDELGLEDYLYGEGLCVIEWPNRLGEMLPASRLHVELTIISEDSRQAVIKEFTGGE
ncbi:tRNA (adenosine(37)-N6)-threonylcarbamoyltransferase complex ATPase subunit type 1 TsaE [Desulfobacterota bacterium M19]